MAQPRATRPRATQRKTSNGAGLFATGRAFVASLFAAVAVVTLPASVQADNRTVPPLPVDWKSTVGTAHPLVGKVWSRFANNGSGGIVDAQELGLAIARARFTLLGEVHDNPDHHMWQAWAIRTISKLRGARLVEGAPQIEVVAMEMLRADQMPALDRFYGRGKEVPRRLGSKAFARLTQWDKSGWPDFEMYAPIIDQAVAEQIIIVPASPSKAEGDAVSKQGYEGLRPGDAKALGLTETFSAPLADALAGEIREGHCNMLPDTAIKPMSLVQRFRDAIMADSLLAVPSYKGGILIAGNSHIRRDRAVPWYLAARGVDPEKIMTVAHTEVVDGQDDPQAYLRTAPDGSAEVDFMVFTPGAQREDMCEKMRSFMAKSKPKAEAADTPSASEPAVAD